MVRREIIFVIVPNNTTLLSTNNYYNWLIRVENIASQSSAIFETRYTA